MIPGLFVANVIVCIVIFLFVINSKFRNRLIAEWHNQQAKLLPAKRKSAEILDKTPVTQEIYRTAVEEDRSRESETSQVGTLLRMDRISPLPTLVSAMC
ncbi:hypothetical protein AVEN_252690-1 [Araneus ventricosus]|uniref:Uncharacterized protein n=1 Tax=Araneus ventricosus TaxID=182803 RepID=A0A4Y2UUU7_ARAVE|nr:hypothetical protein AVEN_252690-1 [Araneus ventricosus]